MKLHGLFVGINAYRDPRINDLAFAAADATAFHDLVASALDPCERSLTLLLDGQATRPSIIKAIGVDLAAAAGLDDLVLIHFACHGSPELTVVADEAARFLIPHDAEHSNLLGTSLDMERDLTALLQRLRAKVIAVFLDACFSGRAGGRTFEGPHLAALRQRRRWQPRLPALELGLGRVVISADDDDEVALESEVLGQGLFSHALMDTLRTAPPDRDAITLAALYDTVAETVSTRTAGAQNPVMNGYVRLARLPYFIRR